MCAETLFPYLRVAFHTEGRCDLLNGVVVGRVENKEEGMGKLHMSRRDFVKVSVVTGAAFGSPRWLSRVWLLLTMPSISRWEVTSSVSEQGVAAAAKWNAALSP